MLRSFLLVLLAGVVGTASVAAQTPTPPIPDVPPVVLPTNPVPPSAAAAAIDAATDAPRPGVVPRIRESITSTANGIGERAGNAVQATKTRFASINPREILRQLNPAHLYRTARTNYREGRFYATDLSEHATWREAMRQSFRPTDMRQNVKAAFLSKIHPARFVGNIFDPLGIELTRQLASGQGLDAWKLLTSMHPVVIATTMVGGGIGDVGGAAIQSVLARFGPVGATMGFIARPLLGFAGQLFSMNVGQGLVQGKSITAAMADSLRNIKPERDFGQLIGGVIGGTLGQVFIPIPLVGGIIGGTIGGIVGGLLGNLLAGVPGFSHLNRAITRALNRWADRLDPRTRNRPPATPPATPPAAPPATPPQGQAVSLLQVQGAAR